MINISIGAMPIAVTSTSPDVSPVAAPADFSQTLQQAVDAGSIQTGGSELGSQNGELQQPTDVIPQEGAQPQKPQENVQPQKHQENVQPQENVQQENTEQVQEQPQQAERELKESIFLLRFDMIREDIDQIIDLNQQVTDETEQPDETVQPSLEPDLSQLYPDLVKELADLLANTEEMLKSPERMQETLKNLISKAFEDLSDPDIQEEEFTEKVLEFLLEFIDRTYGGETEDSSIFPGSDDDDTDVMDVLLQAVVQMLENIRSENADDGVTEDAAEDVEGVEQIPDTNMAKENVGTAVNQLLGEEEKQAVQLEAVTETETVAAAATEEVTGTVTETATAQQNGEYAAQPEKPEYPEYPQVETVSTDETVTEALGTPTAQPAAENITADNTVKTENEAEEIPEDKPAAEAVQPAETADAAEDSALYQAAAQTAELIFTAFTAIVQAQEHAPEHSVLEKTGSIHERIETPMPKPADELEELSRLVKGGDHIRPVEAKFDPHQVVIGPVKPVEETASAGETLLVEAAVAKPVPQITLNHVFAGSENGAEQVVTQIVSEIFNQLPENGGTTTFVMTLNPESLGKVTVKLVEEAGKISVSITAHNKHTAEILSERYDALQTAMKENGTQLEKYQVVYAPEKDERSDQQSFDGSSKNPYVKQDDEDSEDDGEFAELLQQVV